MNAEDREKIIRHNKYFEDLAPSLDYINNPRLNAPRYTAVVHTVNLCNEDFENQKVYYYVDFAGSSFMDVNFSDCLFIECNFNGCNFYKCKFSNTIFVRGHLSGMFFEKCEFVEDGFVFRDVELFDMRRTQCIENWEKNCSIMDALIPQTHSFGHVTLNGEGFECHPDTTR